jgi:hypothetical protein
MGRGVFRFRVRDAQGAEVLESLGAPQVKGSHRELERQTPPMSDRDEVIFLLQTAAEIEHSLLAQYLYAAYSLNTEGKQLAWRNTLLLIAREEMAHLLSVQNLLRVLGGPLNFEREDYPFNVFYPFPFQLEPVSLKSIARYVLAEMPEPGTIPAALGFDINEVKRDAEVTDESEMVNRVGALFALLLKLVDKLLDPPGTETQPPDFRPNTVKWQGQPDEGWTAGLDDLVLSAVRNKAEAITLIERIGKQGEGPEEPVGDSQSHFRRLFKIYTEIKALSAPVDSRVLPINPTTHEPLEGQSNPNFIAAPLSRAWADLFNSRYRLLLANLAHILTLSREDQAEAKSRGEILGWIFTEMSTNLATIAETLATSARDNPPKFKDPEQKILIAAGPPFILPYTLQLPDQPIDRWRHHEQLFAEAELRIKAVKKELKGSNAFLDTMLGLDQQNLNFIKEQIRKASSQTGDTMAITDIQELRLLPPLAIARFGSSPEPMENYVVQIDEADVTGFRKLVPAETLVVDRASGEITGAVTPAGVNFRDANGRIKPVSPFLELWARFDNSDMLEPLTSAHLSELGLTPANVVWHVRTGNHKLHRRTGDPNDKIEADSGTFSDHAAKPLTGLCANFKDGKSVPHGTVQYLKPTESFPDIRLRFTPATGKVYGHRAGDLNTVDNVYDSARGRWDTHNDGDPLLPPGTPLSTLPIQIYARDQQPGPNQDLNLGYLDDSCDGIVEVDITLNNKTRHAFARISVGPPDFAPDSFHPRSVADEIEQILFGPEVTEEVSVERATDLIRRALETMRLMNSAEWNRRYSGNAFPADVANYASARSRHANVLNALQGLKAAPGTPERDAAVGALSLIHSMLRRFEQVLDRSQLSRQLMPAMMRGSDSLDLAVTRRSRRIIEKAARDFSQVPTPDNPAENDMIRVIQELAFHANRHMKFDLPDGRKLSDLFSDPPALLEYLKSNKARGLAAGTLLDKPLVVAGDPDASAFIGILSKPGHPMQNAFNQNDATTGKKRIDIVRDWISSLT